MAYCKLSPSQESLNEQIQNQIDAHLCFDSQGIFHEEFVPPGQTIHQIIYREFLESLRKWVARVRPGIARNLVLYHDNAPYHTAVPIYEFLAEKHSCVSSAPLFEGSQSLCPLYIPPAQKRIESARFPYCGW